MNGLDVFMVRATEASRELKGKGVGPSLSTCNEVKAIYQTLLEIVSRLRDSPFDASLESRFQVLIESIREYGKGICALHEKLTGLCQVIERLCRGSNCEASVEEAVVSLERFIKERLPDRIILRGKHVHSLQDDDRILSWLRQYKLWASHLHRSASLDEWLEVRFESVRKYQADRLHTSNKNVVKVLDQYFNQLREILFDEGEPFRHSYT